MAISSLPNRGGIDGTTGEEQEAVRALANHLRVQDTPVQCEECVMLNIQLNNLSQSDANKLLGKTMAAYSTVLKGVLANGILQEEKVVVASPLEIRLQEEWGALKNKQERKSFVRKHWKKRNGSNVQLLKSVTSLTEKNTLHICTELRR